MSKITVESVKTSVVNFIQTEQKNLIKGALAVGAVVLAVVGAKALKEKFAKADATLAEPAAITEEETTAYDEAEEEVVAEVEATEEEQQ